MAKAYRLKEIEAEHGERLETLIPRLLIQLGGQTAVAIHLGTSLKTIADWCEDNAVVKRPLWGRKEDLDQIADQMMERLHA